MGNIIVLLPWLSSWLEGYGVLLIPRGYMRNPHRYALLGLPWCLLDTMGVPSAFVTSGLWHIHTAAVCVLLVCCAACS